MRPDARPSAAGDFAAGVDGKTGRYSVLGSFPAVDSVHQAMHDYHSESEVTRGLSLGRLYSCVCTHWPLNTSMAAASICMTDPCL